MFMMKFFLPRSEKEALSNLFENIDDNKDSRISLKDLTLAMKEKYSMQLSNEQLDKMDKQLNFSKHDGITYTEFLMAACNKQLLLSEASLKHTFSFIDTNNNSFFSRQELGVFLGVADETYVGLVIEEADDDCDGGITFKEF